MDERPKFFFYNLKKSFFFLQFLFPLGFFLPGLHGHEDAERQKSPQEVTSEPAVVCCFCWRPQPTPLTAPIRDLQGAPADDHTVQSLPLVPAPAQACLSLQVLTHGRCIFFPSSRDPHQMLTRHPQAGVLGPECNTEDQQPRAQMAGRTVRPRASHTALRQDAPPGSIAPVPQHGCSHPPARCPWQQEVQTTGDATTISPSEPGGGGAPNPALLGPRQVDRGWGE